MVLNTGTAEDRARGLVVSGLAACHEGETVRAELLLWRAANGF